MSADALLALAQATGAPKGPLEELLPELLEPSPDGGWLTHLVVLRTNDSAELTCLAAPDLPPCVVLPGSFNPIHEGHEAMARCAARALGRPIDAVLFEICAVNADKGALPADELQRRVEALAARGHRTLLTRATLFAHKAALCAGCDFAVGYDTYRRIVDAKYYAPPGRSPSEASEEERRGWVVDALRQLRSHGIRVAVAGRLDGEEFRSLEGGALLDLPDDLKGMFMHIPRFRVDISSTEIRQRQVAAAQA